MKIKDLFKDIEVANKINEKVRRTDVYVTLVYDGGRGFYSTRTFKEFKKMLKEEFISCVGNYLLNNEIKLNKEFILPATGTVYEIILEK